MARRSRDEVSVCQAGVDSTLASSFSVSFQLPFQTRGFSARLLDSDEE